MHVTTVGSSLMAGAKVSWPSGLWPKWLPVWSLPPPCEEDIGNPADWRRGWHAPWAHGIWCGLKAQKANAGYELICSRVSAKIKASVQPFSHPHDLDFHNNSCGAAWDVILHDRYGYVPWVGKNVHSSRSLVCSSVDAIQTANRDAHQS